MQSRFAVLAGLALALSSSAAFADCKEEVEEAFARQRKMSAFRMEANIISEQGPMLVTVDYVQPDRMRQQTRTVLTSAVVETVLVGGRAWINDNGQGWKELRQEDVATLVEQMRAAVVEPPGDLGAYTCAGKMPLEGKEHLAYKLDDATGSTKKGQAVDPSKPFRLLFVDPVTGLPVRSTMATQSRADKPFFKSVYSYPADISIEPPK